MAFQEADFGFTESLATNETFAPLYRQLVGWWAELFRCAGSHRHMATSMSDAFLQAGLPLPHMHIDGVVVHGPDWNGYDYVEQSVRSTLPLLIRLGITTAEEADVDTFAERLRAETISQRSIVVVPLLIGAWICKPC